MLALTYCQDHILTENIWFVCSETSYSGDERRCHGCGIQNTLMRFPCGIWFAGFFLEISTYCIRHWKQFCSGFITFKVEFQLLPGFKTRNVSANSWQIQHMLKTRIQRDFAWLKYKLDNSKLGSTQQQKICWHWLVARIIYSKKIYGLYGWKHHIVEMRGGVTDAGQTNKQTTNNWR